ncbi:hypothetical protein Tco_1478511, partial [Tanacetum coccineum]
MSDSEHSTVTYTSISSDDGSLDVGSPKVIVYRYDGLPMMLEDTYAHVEAAMQEPPPPDYVPEPAYPEFIPPADDVFPAEEQPLPATDPKEEDDEDPKEDPADCPTDRDDEEEEESSRDDADEEEEVEGKDEEEEEEEHLASADSVPPDCCRYITITITSAITTYIILITTSPDTIFTTTSIYGHDESYCTIYLLFSTSIWDTAISTYTVTYIITTFASTPTDCRADVPEVRLPPRKRLCIAPGPRYEIGESSSAPTTRPTRGFRRDCGFVANLDAEIRRDLDKEIGYRITDIWVDLDEIAKEIPATDVAELGQRMTDFVMTVRQGTDEIYVRLDDAQDARSVMSGQLNLLRKDRLFHDHTARLMESEARVAREAWSQSMDASDTACSEVRTLWTAVLAQQTKIKDLWPADRR